MADDWKPLTDKEIFLKSRDTSWANELGGVVPYYPSVRHIEKNLAPELGITRAQIEALAQANAEATKNKLMSPALLNKMLPTLLIEGASGTRGWGYPDTKPYRDILTKAGLPPTVEEIHKLIAANTDDESARENLSGKFKFSNYDNDLITAKMMHAVMAAKALNYGDDLAIERWNGVGTAKGGWADAKNHARKVEELTALMNHPKNKELMSTWNSLLEQHRGGEGQQLKPAFKEYDWEQENLPMILGKPINALRKALPSMPDVSLKNIQRAVRNWTAGTPSDYKKGGKVKLPKNHKNGGGSSLI
jgi:hypothetical protein